MARWFSRRWALAALVGATVTVEMAAGRDGEGPPKVGTVMSLNIDGKGERQFKVVKSEKQPDGTYLSELKDTKSGETITLLDKADPPAGPKSADPPKPTDPPKAKPRTTDPLTPPMSAVLDPNKTKEPEKRPVLGRIFGDKDKDKDKPADPAAAMTPKADPPADPAKKPGLLGRIFGSKKPAGPSMPSATVAPATAPASKPSGGSPPPVLPVPQGGLNAPSSAPAPFPSTTAEPPRVMPAKPAVPPSPAVAAPVTPAPVATPQTSAPPIAVPAPMPAAAPPLSAPPVVPPPPAPLGTSLPPLPTPTPALPAPPVPLPVPSIPVPPAGAGLPPIAVPPGGTSAAQPIQVVLPVNYVPPQVAFDREVQPFVTALQSMSAPSARLTSAKALAEGRHGSTDGVKTVLFQAAQLDPCGEVRAACITHLCNLGYFSPQFQGYAQAACNDADEQVREAAKAACEKMFRR